MATQWASQLNEAVYPLGNPPQWAPFPLPMTPAMVVSVESPLGPDSILERCELFISASLSLVSDTDDGDAFQAASVSILAAAEVYPVTSGGIPDPRTSPDSQFVLTAAASQRAAWWGDPAHTTVTHLLSTGSYVTSEAKRGPSHYGGGTPVLRVGIYTPNLFNPTWLGSANTSEIYHLRALWKI